MCVCGFGHALGGIYSNIFHKCAQPRAIGTEECLTRNKIVQHDRTSTILPPFKFVAGLTQCSERERSMLHIFSMEIPDTCHNKLRIGHSSTICVTHREAADMCGHMRSDGVLRRDYLHSVERENRVDYQPSQWHKRNVPKKQTLPTQHTRICLTIIRRWLFPWHNKPPLCTTASVWSAYLHVCRVQPTSSRQHLNVFRCGIFRWLSQSHELWCLQIIMSKTRGATLLVFMRLSLAHNTYTHTHTHV